MSACRKRLANHQTKKIHALEKFKEIHDQLFCMLQDKLETEETQNDNFIFIVIYLKTFNYGE